MPTSISNTITRDGLKTSILSDRVKKYQQVSPLFCISYYFYVFAIILMTLILILIIFLVIMFIIYFDYMLSIVRLALCLNISSYSA
jgi:hypothetical protein